MKKGKGDIGIYKKVWETGKGHTCAFQNIPEAIKIDEYLKIELSKIPTNSSRQSAP